MVCAQHGVCVCVSWEDLEASGDATDTQTHKKRKKQTKKGGGGGRQSGAVVWQSSAERNN